MGLHTFVTNVNLPNRDRIGNPPLGAVVETNAVFSNDSVKPVMAGAIPPVVNELVSTIAFEQQLVIEAVAERNLEKAFLAFSSDPLVTCSLADARKLFDEMIENTKKYLTIEV